MLQTFRPVLEREVFLLGGVRGPVRRWPLADFFDGLETVELHSMRDGSSTAGASLGQGDPQATRPPRRRSSTTCHTQKHQSIRPCRRPTFVEGRPKPSGETPQRARPNMNVWKPAMYR